MAFFLGQPFWKKVYTIIRLSLFPIYSPYFLTYFSLSSIYEHITIQLFLYYSAFSVTKSRFSGKLAMGKLLVWKQQLDNMRTVNKCSLILLVHVHIESNYLNFCWKINYWECPTKALGIITSDSDAILLKLKLNLNSHQTASLVCIGEKAVFLPHQAYSKYNNRCE